MLLCWMWSSCLTISAQVRECSEKFLHDLERCWRGSLLMSGIADIVIHHAQHNLQVLVCKKSAGVITYFQVFVKYCSNQLLQDQTLKRLK